MGRNTWVAVFVGVLIVVGAVWLSTSQRQKQQTTQPAQTQVAPTESSATQEAETGEQAKEISVEGSEFKFTPNTLSVKKGEKVKLAFKNAGSFPHNVTVNELNVSTNTIGGGETDSVEFTADKTGTFEMYCSVGNHRQRGMVGKVSVE